MLYRETIAVCSQIHTKHINTLCGQNVELLNVKPGGKYSKPSASNGLPLETEFHPNSSNIKHHVIPSCHCLSVTKVSQLKPVGLSLF